MRTLMALVVLPMFVSLLAAEPGKPVTLELRTRVQPFKSTGEWQAVPLRREFDAKECAIIICDMWDKHWCENATSRCDEIAKRMEPMLQAARAKGMTIIHAPSDCMGYYQNAPQRQRMLQLPKVEPPKNLELTDPKLPIDDSDGGCDDLEPKKSHKAWSRQHPALTIADLGDRDYISDNGREVYNLLKAKGIKTLFICGVHTNMCVLGRSFAIRQMCRWGVSCVLIRDLTDTMYNPKKAPFVSHEEGTELVIQHIEKYWCPTVLAKELMK
jgi:nicotinamidase-related amidase